MSIGRLQFHRVEYIVRISIFFVMVLVGGVSVLRFQFCGWRQYLDIFFFKCEGALSIEQCMRHWHCYLFRRSGRYFVALHIIAAILCNWFVPFAQMHVCGKWIFKIIAVVDSKFGHSVGAIYVSACIVASFDVIANRTWVPIGLWFLFFRRWRVSDDQLVVADCIGPNTVPITIPFCLNFC